VGARDLTGEHIKTVYIPFFTPMNRVIDRVRLGFQHAPVLLVKGFNLRMFCLGEPSDIAQLFADRETSRSKLPRLLPRVQHVMGNGTFIMKGGDDWRFRRDQVQIAFRRAEFAGYLNSLPRLVKHMLDLWSQHARRAEPFDVFEEMRLLVMRINMQLFFSQDLDDAEARTLERETHFLEDHFVCPSPLIVPFPGNLLFREYARSLRDRIHRLIQERRITEEELPDLLTHLIRLKNDVGDPLNDDEIIDEALSIFFGAFVLSVSLTWGLFLIASHSHVQQKIIDEVKGREVLPEEAVRLSYLQSVYKEVLRLYPASWVQPRWVRKSLVLGHVRIPAESLVIPVVYLVHRDPRFWPQPNSFVPDRFAAGQSATPPMAYFPFSSGPRACVGAGLAPFILQTVWAMVISRYRVIFSPRHSNDPQIEFGFGITPRNGMPLVIEQRP
jgi:cytochrome P450